MPATQSPEAPAAINLVKPRCPECGSVPMGTGCYHICSNSVHYYSPEMERYDEANWDRADYMRETYGDDIDPAYEAMCVEMDDRANGEFVEIPAPVTDFDPSPAVCADDDIPF